MSGYLFDARACLDWHRRAGTVLSHEQEAFILQHDGQPLFVAREAYRETFTPDGRRKTEVALYA